MALIGFIGIGNMGYPMLVSAMDEFGVKEVIYTSADVNQLEFVREKTGSDYVSDNVSLVKQCKYIVMAVKPQQYKKVCDEIKPVIGCEHIILSPMAGITTKEIKDTIGADIKVIRFMPNTAAMLKEGMSCICFSENEFSEEEKSIAKRFFTSFGKFAELPEHLMNAGICANGSSPAYVYIFIEALADSVVKYGIPRDTAYKLVSQTVLGAAKMVLETNEHPAKLKDNVCSPGGTTIAGISALDEYGFRNAIIKASDACYERAVELGKLK